MMPEECLKQLVEKLELLYRELKGFVCPGYEPEKKLLALYIAELKDCRVSKQNVITKLEEYKIMLSDQEKAYIVQIDELEIKVLELTAQLQGILKPTDVPTADITYKRPVLVGKDKWSMVDVDVRSFVMSDFLIEKAVKSLRYDGTQDLDFLVPKIYLLAKKNYKYGADSNYGFSEYWMFPYELRHVRSKLLAGDCVANHEEIYTSEGLKIVGDLKEGDMVLSYNFDSKKFCEKPIVKIWEKGELPCKRVHLRNGSTIDVTENHPLWVRTNQYGESKYEKTCLSDVSESLWYRRKMPVAKKIPYKVKDLDWLNEELCFVAGHFIAEGWTEKKSNRVFTSGYDCPIIAEALEKNNIPFSEKSNSNGVPIINFLKSDFRNFLGKFKTSSLNITIPEEIFHLPEKKLRKFLEGYLLGDGYIDKRKYEFKHSNKFVYNTISENLKDDLVRLHLQLGEPLYSYLSVNHGGLGKNPIWRIHYNPESFFGRDYGYDGLSETSIVKVEDLGKVKVRDFHVKDTSTFFFKNGLCSHQCDDWANWIGAHLKAANIPRNRWLISCGFTRNNIGHATVYVKDSTEIWRHLNSTKRDYGYSDLKKYPSKNNKSDTIGIKPNGFWFSYNDVFSIHQFESAEAETSFNNILGGKVKITRTAR